MFIYNLKINSKNIVKIAFAIMSIIITIFFIISIYKIITESFRVRDEINKPEISYIEPNNYTDILKEVYENIDNYVGQTICFTGYVYRNSDFDKDYFVLDARSNSGGSDYPQIKLMYYLKSKKYQGTLIVLQDNWSYSSGELWHIIGKEEVDFPRILVGTHSGGMQTYGNCKTFTNDKLDISIYFGTTDFTKTLPSNYLGEGKGYEPDVWATTETMKEVLEEMGIDTGDIIFQ